MRDVQHGSLRLRVEPRRVGLSVRVSTYGERGGAERAQERTPARPSICRRPRPTARIWMAAARTARTGPPSGCTRHPRTQLCRRRDRAPRGLVEFPQKEQRSILLLSFYKLRLLHHETFTVPWESFLQVKGRYNMIAHMCHYQEFKTHRTFIVLKCLSVMVLVLRASSYMG
jgi:hypothetical protein